MDEENVLSGLLYLDTSETSPWQHKVQLTKDGRLVLHWLNAAGGRTRTFTAEETLNLYRFLERYKDAIVR